MSKQIVLSDITKDLIIAEYNALREEVNQIYRMQQSIMLQSLVFLGILVTFFIALKKDYQDAQWIFFLPLLIIPVASYVVILTSLGLHLREDKINRYLYLLTEEYGIEFEYNEKKYHGWSGWYSSVGNEVIDRIDLAPVILSFVAMIWISILGGVYWLDCKFLVKVGFVICHACVFAIAFNRAMKVLKGANEMHKLKQELEVKG